MGSGLEERGCPSLLDERYPEHREHEHGALAHASEEYVWREGQAWSVRVQTCGIMSHVEE